MNNKVFINKAIDIAENYKTAYIWGGLGRPITKAYLDRAIAQYPNINTNFAADAKQYIDKPKAYFFDCVGLIKTILWGWHGKEGHAMGGAVYTSNNVPDCTADTMIHMCADVSANFDNILPGEAVWLPGHIGIYIGKGKVVECTPAFNNGVQITNVENMSSQYHWYNNYPSRGWNKHGKLPWVEYDYTENYDAIKAELNSLADWATEPITNLHKWGFLKGTGHTLGLTKDLTRLLVIMYRILDKCGLFKEFK